MDREEIHKLVDKSYNDAMNKYSKSMDVTEWTNDYMKKFSAYESGHVILEFGDVFLFETICDSHSKSILKYPEIGVFVKYNIYDQALVTEYVTKNRTWMDRVKYNSNPDPKYNYWMPISDRVSEVVDFVEWSDSIYIYGKWDKMPGWKELKKSYQKTMWFHKTEEEIIDLKLRTLI